MLLHACWRGVVYLKLRTCAQSVQHGRRMGTMRGRAGCSSQRLHCSSHLCGSRQLKHSLGLWVGIQHAQPPAAASHAAAGCIHLRLPAAL